MNFDWEKLVVWSCMLIVSFGVWYVVLKELWRLLLGGN